MTVRKIKYEGKVSTLFPRRHWERESKVLVISRNISQHFWPLLCTRARVYLHVLIEKGYSLLSATSFNKVPIFVVVVFILFYYNSNRITYLRTPFMIAVRSSRLYRCKTGSSEERYSCCMAVTKGRRECGKEASIIRTLSTSANKARTGTVTYYQ